MVGGGLLFLEDHKACEGLSLAWNVVGVWMQWQMLLPCTVDKTKKASLVAFTQSLQSLSAACGARGLYCSTRHVPASLGRGCQRLYTYPFALHLHALALTLAYECFESSCVCVLVLACACHCQVSSMHVCGWSWALALVSH